jgi:hypothetical protein
LLLPRLWFIDPCTRNHSALLVLAGYPITSYYHGIYVPGIPAQVQHAACGIRAFPLTHGFAINHKSLVLLDRYNASVEPFPFAHSGVSTRAKDRQA